MAKKKRVIENGTSKKKYYTQPEIFGILKAYKDNNYSAKKTAQEYGVSIYSINMWRKKFPEVFEAKPSADVLQRIVNQKSHFEVKAIELSTKKKQIAILALDEIKARLEDKELIKRIAIKELIEVVKLAEKENEIDDDSDRESYQRVLRKYEDFKAKQKELAEDAEIIQ